MTNSTNPAVGSTELIKGLEKAKPPADEHPVMEDEAVKGKPALDRIDFVRDAHNRVILYAFSGQSRWIDRGTGHVNCVQSRDQPDEWWIVVRLESNEKNVLESRILPDTIYQQQPGAVIVWSEPDDSKLKLCVFEFAGHTVIWDKICQIQLEGKRRNTEAERRQTSESNRQLISELQDKNRETLERNRELEQELSNSQAKLQNLEAKFDQTDVSLIIAALKENVGKLENGEILRLQTEVTKLSNENEMKNEELSEIRKKLVEFEERIADMNKENAEMVEKKVAEELQSWEHLRRLLDGAIEYSEGIRKQKEQSLHEQSLPGLDPIVPPAASEQLSQEEVTEIGPDGDSAKGLRVDTQKNLEEPGAKNEANVA